MSKKPNTQNAVAKTASKSIVASIYTEEEQRAALVARDMQNPERIVDAASALEVCTRIARTRDENDLSQYRAIYQVYNNPETYNGVKYVDKRGKTNITSSFKEWANNVCPLFNYTQCLSALKVAEYIAPNGQGTTLPKPKGCERDYLFTNLVAMIEGKRCWKEVETGKVNKNGKKVIEKVLALYPLYERVEDEYGIPVYKPDENGSIVQAWKPVTDDKGNSVEKPLFIVLCEMGIFTPEVKGDYIKKRVNADSVYFDEFGAHFDFTPATKKGEALPEGEALPDGEALPESEALSDETHNTIVEKVTFSAEQLRRIYELVCEHSDGGVLDESILDALATFVEE